MPPWIASFIFAIGIAGLFILNRDREVRTSKALWLPVFWLLIAGSRPVSVWLQMGPPSSPDQYLEGSPLDRTVFLGLLAAGVSVLIARQKTVARFLRANGLFLLFLFYCAASITWSDYPEVAFKRWIKFFGDFVMVLIVLTDLTQFGAIKPVLARVGFVVLPLSVLFIKYYPELDRAYAPHWEGTAFYVGVASDKNMLGMTCLVLD
jgi:exopolysaccharide production protein ExoQ